MYPYLPSRLGHNAATRTVRRRPRSLALISHGPERPRPSPVNVSFADDLPDNYLQLQSPADLGQEMGFCDAHIQDIPAEHDSFPGVDNTGLGLQAFQGNATTLSFSKSQVLLSNSGDSKFVPQHTVGTGVEGGKRRLALVGKYSPPSLSSPRLNNVKGRTLACPFSKRYPKEHSDCQRYRLRRPKDALQHVKRRHSQKLVCTRCGARFDLLPAFSETRDPTVGSCIPSGDLPIGIASQHHVDALGHTSENWVIRGKDADEQWMCLWDKLFPDAQRPASPYLESRQEEMASELSYFWTQNSPRITAEVVEMMKPTWTADDGDTARAFDLFLHHLLLRFAGAGDGTGSQLDSGYSSKNTSRRSALSPSEKTELDDGFLGLPSLIGEKRPVSGNQNGGDSMVYETASQQIPGHPPTPFDGQILDTTFPSDPAFSLDSDTPFLWDPCSQLSRPDTSNATFQDR
ncbi:hypothetical protein B0T16DRAFT_455921 [Cercophora newfieldiana]|uniref:C2H2-type domain-containing protein n=1 Tax=Cercophora newfieldiana TaxID=92897 RepID=A0AA40CT62_9PEZI|nr:hypothetical protein B0T16DRAFT_455921 [Cercophora newfieldiana]